MQHAASPEGGCMWDACEALLKASLAPKEDVLLRAWVRGWTQNMPCFPRLHVITAQEHIHRARVHFRGVPNVTFRENAFPPRVANNSYLLIQIHILWADNFTTAPYVLYFDTDAVPVLPLRCHHLWDDDDRLLMHAWNRAPNRTTAWVSTVSQLLLRAEPLRAAAAGAPFTPSLQNNDYMSFWPIVAPRSLLSHVRRIVARAYGTYFDDAFALMPEPSHADLIGKVALLLRPHATHQAPCPALRSEYGALHGAHAWPASPFSCARWVAPVEHVRHPMQGCHTTCAAFKNYAQAAEYSHLLLNQSAAFVGAGGPIPARLWHYRGNRSAEQLAETRAFLLRDEAGRVCGLDRHGRVPHW